MTDLLNSNSALEMDERVVARAALDAAEEQLQSLCASHAGTFVAVERRGRAATESLLELQAAIESVKAQMDTVQQALEQQEEDNDDHKATTLAALSEKHRVRRRTLLQHSSLLELLELPSLMDACVRSNLYDEALSIAAFCNTLERRHGTATTTTDAAAAGDGLHKASSVVTRVLVQIRSRQVDLYRHLLARLKTNVTMPECLEVVTALRRLNSIDLERQGASSHGAGGVETSVENLHASMEFRLQVDFLEARDAWLDSMAVPTSSRASFTLPSSSNHATSSSEQLLDAIERYRTRVFEVATQYNAIFRAQTNTTDSSRSLLAMWTSRRVHSFLTLLAVHLAPLDDSAQLRDALDASVFFASSMGRLGADFTAQLPALFEPKMLHIVANLWKDGVSQLAETLRLCREVGVASPLTSSHSAAAVSESATPTSALDEPQPPPRQLLALPPLARLVNSFLTGLNELRRCLLPGIFSSLRLLLDKQLKTLQLEVIQANERAVMAPGLRGEAKALRELATRYVEVFASVVDPYVRGSLEAALGNGEQATHYHTILRENEQETEKEEEGDEEKAEEVEEQVEASTTNEQETSTVEETVTKEEEVESRDISAADDGPESKTDSEA